MDKGELVGEIVRLQIQRMPIKVKGTDYLPERILPVERAAVDYLEDALNGRSRRYRLLFDGDRGRSRDPDL